jgi:nucleotide-binding universal stress UspA family protein
MHMKILIAYDGSSTADAAISDLRRAGLPAKAEALVVCVEDGGLPPAEDTEATEARHEGSWRSKLATAELFAQQAGGRINSYFPEWTVSCEALWGSPAKTILDTSERWRPDLLVVGSHGRSRVARFFLGSVSLELIHKATCSVRVVHPGGLFANTGPIQIVIGNDGSTEAEKVIRTVAARSWPEQTKAQIVSAVQTLVPVITSLEANTYAQEPAFTAVQQVDELERIRLKKAAEDSALVLRNAGLATGCTVVDGDPREVILAQAALSKADAIFVGARGLGRMERLLLGSVSSYIVTHAPCSVEVVRQAV